jgi:hypothetical protein
MPPTPFSSASSAAVSSTGFDERIETRGPDFGLDHVLDQVAHTADSLTFGCFPHSPLWRRDNRHPLLPALVAHVRAGYRPPHRSEVWLPPAEQDLFAP